MPLFRRPEITESLLRISAAYRLELIPLRNLPIQLERVLDIGCASGREAIVLMWFLGAPEVIGLDEDISRAEECAHELTLHLVESIQALTYPQVTEDDRDWWATEVPQFLREGKFPRYIEQDISEKDQLISRFGTESFSLAYCSSVLCYVHRGQGPTSVRSVLEGVHALLQPNAWFAVNEPLDQDLRYFGLELGEAGFEVTCSDSEGRAQYLCRRPA